MERKTLASHKAHRGIQSAEASIVGFVGNGYEAMLAQRYDGNVENPSHQGPIADPCLPVAPRNPLDVEVASCGPERHFGGRDIGAACKGMNLDGQRKPLDAGPRVTNEQRGIGNIQIWFTPDLGDILVGDTQKVTGVGVKILLKRVEGIGGPNGGCEDVAGLLLWRHAQRVADGGVFGRGNENAPGVESVEPRGVRGIRAVLPDFYWVRNSASDVPPLGAVPS